MKRILSALAILASSLMAFNACDELEIPAAITIPDAESLELFDTGITFSASKEGGVQTVQLSFETTYKWSVSIEDMEGDWLTVSPTSGEGGPATITVTATDNTSTEPRSAQVTVACSIVKKSAKVTQLGAEPAQPVPAEEITLNMQAAEMKVGETLQLIATVKPENATDEVVWESLMEENATVDQTGLVTALKEGYASITATAGKASATCRIAIKEAGGDVQVESIKLDQEEIHMMPGQTLQLNATVVPADASVSWSSSRTGVATVDQKGEITAVALGETVITAKAGDKSAECLVKVEQEVGITGISLNETALTLKEGETFQLVATILPETATPQTIEWVSSIPAVATVDQTGLVTAVRKGGPAKIWAVIKTSSGYDINAYCEVTVTSDAPSIESITVSPATVTINATEETILTATITPDGTGAVITWTSDNTAIATVEKISDTQAKVTGVGEGRTKVIASVGDVFDYSEVEVKGKPSGGGVEEIALNQTTLHLSFYETAQLVATLRPADASAEITWTSSDESVALVSNGNTPGADGSIMPAGTVIAKNKEGQAVITAVAGSVAAYCTVTVSAGSDVPVESISLNKTELTLQVGESYQLVATILPANATNKTVAWSMSGARSYQLSLDTNGLISALAECEATITVRSAYDPANLYATCRVTVVAGSSTGDEAVDLGLPSGLKWRSMNVGASKPEDYGNYYAWGETGTKTSYIWSNYKYSSNDIYGDGVGKTGKKVLTAEDDAATVNVGSDWRTPTNKEWKELKENCSWRWTTSNGVNGMLVTGPNGNSIFLPAAGYFRSSLTNRGSYGSYWSASYGSDENALGWDFINSDVSSAYLDRSMGCSVRPVKD
ncbi:MAG: Ig-like domain-containing protein [Bacteroidales bacterium]|nr:Ig-like domain-containing protein [Bacteroidales bacterium]